MKEYRNFIIINNDKYIITASFANCTSEVTYKSHKRLRVDKKFTDNTDMLKVLNKHMAQILKWKNDEQALNVYYVLIPPKLCKVIKNKMYRDWLETGKTASGFSIHPEELEQWNIFNALYKSVFSDICFKPNNTYNSKSDANKIYRHVVFTKNVVDKMHNYLDRLEESTAIKTIGDLLKYR